MRGLTLLAAVAAAGVVAFSGLAASAATTCTYEQKQARVAALAAFQRSVKGKTLTAAQRRKLRRLRTAAACTVPPLPASSSASCSPQLAPHPAVPWVLHEGAPQREVIQRSLGHVQGLMLFLDYEDAPGAADGPPSLIAPPFFTDLSWFGEVSYGRLSVSFDYLDRWIRMPNPTANYIPLHTEALRYVRDAVAAADPYVDFSRYQHVAFMNARGWASNNPALTLPPGSGAFADGVEIRLGNIFDPSSRTNEAGASRILLHEFTHTLGLPDLGGLAADWDPLAAPPSRVHLLGWHKWLLQWLDAEQLTCVDSPGTVEETLTPIAVKGGKKLVVVPLTATTAYAVEVRRPIGFDRSACDEGVIVYAIDSARASYEAPIVLKGKPRCGNVSPGAFKTGQAFEDGSVKVQVLATNGRDYRVRVSKK